MVNDEIKQYREPLAFGLLAIGALYLIAALSLLFKSLGGAGFAQKAAAVGNLFEAPVPVLALVVAVLLVTRYGDLTRNARTVVLAAMGIAGLDALFAVITFFAQFGADGAFGFAGVNPAGKVVGAILGLANLAFLAAAAFFLWTSFKGLPAPTPAAAAWSPEQGYAQYGPGPGAAAGGQPGGASWGPPAAPTPPAPAGWGQPATPGPGRRRVEPAVGGVEPADRAGVGHARRVAADLAAERAGGCLGPAG